MSGHQIKKGSCGKTCPNPTAVKHRKSVLAGPHAWYSRVCLLVGFFLILNLYLCQWPVWPKEGVLLQARDRWERRGKTFFW